jgi:hypothetical protein
MSRVECWELLNVSANILVAIFRVFISTFKRTIIRDTVSARISSVTHWIFIVAFFSKSLIVFQTNIICRSAFNQKCCDPWLYQLINTDITTTYSADVDQVLVSSFIKATPCKQISLKPPNISNNFSDLVSIFAVLQWVLFMAAYLRRRYRTGTASVLLPMAISY